LGAPGGGGGGARGLFWSPAAGDSPAAVCFWAIQDLMKSELSAI
jgi:hypothetical protein